MSRDDIMSNRNVRKIFADTKELANALLSIAEDSDSTAAYYLKESAISLMGLYRDACRMQKRIERDATLLQQALIDEREACALVCEAIPATWTRMDYDEACMECAKAIRARGGDA